MNINFDWVPTSTISTSEKGYIEAEIQKRIEGPNPVCHPVQAPTVRLNAYGPFPCDLAGNIKCDCGKPCWKINGKISATISIYFSNPAEDQ